MKSVEFIDGMVGNPTGIPTAWWTIHNVSNLTIPIVTDDLFRLVSGQHLGKVELWTLPVTSPDKVNWLLQPTGFLRVLIMLAGIMKVSVEDETGMASKPLMSMMGVLAGGKIQLTGSVIADSTFLVATASER